MNVEEFAFAYNINSTGMSGIITMTNPPKLVCYCDEENSKTILKALNPPLPPAEGAEQRIRVRNILQDFYRRGEYELEQAEEDIMRLFQPQPTAEGAEEILLSHPYLKVMYDDTAGEVCMVEQAIWAIEKFATLHAQRIADKKYADTEADGYVFCGKCGKMKEI